MAAKRQAQVGKRGTCEVRGCGKVIFLKPNRLDSDNRYKCADHLKSPKVDGPIPKAQTLAAWEADPKRHPSAAQIRADLKVTKADPKKLKKASTLEEVEAAAN